MQVSTTIRSAPSILVGAFFVGVTGFVILEDVIRHGVPISTRHIMVGAVILGTVFFGHAIWSEWKVGRWATALGSLLLFLLGTSYCVLSSAGRNAEVVSGKAVLASSLNASRDIARQDMIDAKKRYDAAMTAENRECASGDGHLCKAARTSTLVRKSQYDDAKLAFAKQPPEQTANGDIHAIALTFARITGSDKVDSIEATLLLTFPFLAALFCEVAAIVSFAIGLGHKTVPVPIEGGKLLPAPDPVAGLLATDKWALSVNARRVKLSDTQLVLKALHQAERPLSNVELAEVLSCTEGEASKKRQACEVLGLLKIEKQGRFLAISPADHVAFDADGNPTNV